MSEWTPETWPSLTIPFAEEERARAWERLSQGEKDTQIAEMRAKTLSYGWCQGCGFRIECLGKDWPERCPRCNHGPQL